MVHLPLRHQGARRIGHRRRVRRDQLTRRIGYLPLLAAGNLAGPLTIGRLFDTVGRKKMISGTYILSGAMLAITAVLFRDGTLNPITQTIAGR